MTPSVLLLGVLVATMTAVSRAAPGQTTACPTGVAAVKPGPAAAGKGSAYTTKYDNINVDMILRNERLLKNYIDCLMDRKPCSREGQLLKEIVPDALQTECSRCSEKQKQLAGTIMAYLLQHKKHYWDELLCKYDPEGKFREKYEVTDEEDED